MQLWSYQPRSDQKDLIISWPTADSPSGYAFYVSHDRQRIVLSADPHWWTTTQLLLPGGKLSKLLDNSSSSDWSPDDGYIALGIDADDFRRVFATICQPHRHLARAVDDVSVGQDVAFGTDDKARAFTAGGLLLPRRSTEKGSESSEQA